MRLTESWDAEPRNAGADMVPYPISGHVYSANLLFLNATLEEIVVTTTHHKLRSRGAVSARPLLAVTVPQ